MILKGGHVINPPRNRFDMAVGHNNLFHGDRYKWSARVQVINLTNEEAPYNFLSTSSGTHYVSPRSITATKASISDRAS